MTTITNIYTIKFYEKGKLIRVFKNQTHKDVLGYKRIVREFPGFKRGGVIVKVDIIDKKTKKVKWTRYLKHFS